MSLLDANLFPNPLPRLAVTNDDGYQSIGIRVLMELAQVHARHVDVVAPESNQSGKGQSISLYPFSIRDGDGTHGAGRHVYVVSGTPADCARVALSRLVKERPDCILSGINAGWNFGQALYVSGTVGAAREAALKGVPAIALSAPHDAPWELMIMMVSRHLTKWLEIAMEQPGIYLNINLPTHNGREWVWTRPTRSVTWDMRTTATANGHMVEWLESFDVEDLDGSVPTDVGAIKRGYVSVSAMHAGDTWCGGESDIPTGREFLAAMDASMG